MKSVLRHPLSIAGILAVTLAAVAFTTWPRTVSPLQFGDNRTAERDRLAKQYGVSKESANQLMARLEREKGITILNSYDMPDGTALDFYKIKGEAPRGKAVEFQGTGHYYKADSAVGKAYHEVLTSLKKSAAGEWATKQLANARERGFYVIPASMIPGGGTIAKAVGQSTLGASTTILRIAVVGTEFPHWRDHKPYRTSGDPNAYDIANSYGIYSTGSSDPADVAKALALRNWVISANSGAQFDWPPAYYADGPGGVFGTGNLYGCPQGLTGPDWDTGAETQYSLSGQHPTAGGNLYKDQNLFANDWYTRLFGPGGLSPFYFENSHGHLKLAGDTSNIVGWLQSHHFLDRMPMRVWNDPLNRTNGYTGVMPSSHFYQPATPMLRPYPRVTNHIIGASLNQLGLTVLFDQDVDSAPSLSNFSVMVPDRKGANDPDKGPGMMPLAFGDGSWLADRYDHRRWTYRNGSAASWGSGWTWNDLSTSHTVTTWALYVDRAWSVQITVPSLGLTNFTIGNGYSSNVGGKTLSTNGQGSGFSLWESDNIGNPKQTPSDLGTTFTTRDTKITSPQFRSNAGNWTDTSNAQKFCRLKSYCYYIHDHTYDGSAYQLAHLMNASGRIDDLAGTIDDPGQRRDRPFPFDHDAQDDLSNPNSGHVLGDPGTQGNHSSAALESDVAAVMADEGVPMSNYDKTIILFPGQGSEGGASDITPHGGGGGAVVPESASLGLLAHELGHSFGTVDLYDNDLYTNAGPPVPNPLYFRSLMMADWSFMASGAGMRLDVWHKLGMSSSVGGPWAQVKPVLKDAPGTSINAAEGTLSDPIILKLPGNPYCSRTDASSWNEYFLLENRYPNPSNQFNDASTPGLYIYHIDTRGSECSETFPAVIVTEASGMKLATRGAQGSFAFSAATRTATPFGGVTGGGWADSSGHRYQARNFTWYPNATRVDNGQVVYSYQANDPISNSLQTFYPATAYSNGLPYGNDAAHPNVTPFSPTDSFSRVLNISDPGPVMTADLYVEPAEVVVEQDTSAQYGPNITSSSTVEQGTKDFHMMTLRLTNTSQSPEVSTKDVVLSNLNVFQSGTSTVPSNIDRASLWAETNGQPGLQTSGTTPDTRLQTAVINNNYLSFTNLGFRIPNTTVDTAHKWVYITYDISRTAQVQPSVTLGSKIIAATDFMPQAPGAPQIMARQATPFAFSGEYRFPITGNAVTIVPAHNVMTVASTSLAPAKGKQGAEVPLLKSLCSLNVADNPPQGTSQLSFVRMWMTGTAIASDLTTAHLYVDTNGNGQFDPGVDQKVSEASLVPDPDNSNALSASFTNFPTPVQVDAALPVTLIFTVSVSSGATPGNTLSCQLRNDTAPLILTSFGLLNPTYNTVATTNFSSTAPYGQNSGVTTIDLANHPPTLTAVAAPAQQLSPTSGKASDTYTYQVVYTSADNNPPDATAGVKVFIDDNPQTMTPVGPAPYDYTLGVTYQYKAVGTLAAGDHRYYFQASDGKVTTQLRPPSAAAFDGPHVNHPPTLSTPSVTPASGGQTGSYKFAVTYTDLDGTAPANIAVFVTNTTTGAAPQSYVMTLASGTPAAGAVYTATVQPSPPGTPIVPIGAGDHTYYFATSDGLEGTYLGTGGNSTTPPAANAQFVGPLVNDPPQAVASGFSPKEGDTGVSTTPLISWDPATDVNAPDVTPTNNLSYVLELTDKAGTGRGDFTPPVYYTATTAAGVANVRIPVASTLAAGDWWYRVTAVDPHGAQSAPSVSVHFKVLPNRAPTAPPSGFSPSNGAVEGTHKGTPTLLWNAASDPDAADTPATLHYVVQLRLMNDGDTWAPTDTAYDYQYTTADGSTQVVIPAASALAEAKGTKSWFWRVRTYDTAGLASDWSVVQYFKVDLQLKPQALLAPTATAMLNPLSGKLMDTYEFHVLFQDPNQAASWAGPTETVRLNIVQIDVSGNSIGTAKSFPMQIGPAPHNWALGVDYSVSVLGSDIGYGPHGYYFSCDNGLVLRSTGTSGKPADFVGPVVEANTAAVLTFTDASGTNVTTPYEEGGVISIKLVDAAHNQKSNAVETWNVTLSSTTAPADSKTVKLTETGINTGIFLGSIATQGGTVVDSTGVKFTINAGTRSVTAPAPITATFVDPYGALIGVPTLGGATATGGVVDRIAPPAMTATELTAHTNADGTGIVLDWSAYLTRIGNTVPDLATWAVYMVDKTQNPSATLTSTVGLPISATVPGTASGYTIPATGALGDTYLIAVAPRDEVPNAITTVSPVSAKTIDTAPPIISNQAPAPSTPTNPTKDVPRDQVISFTLSDVGSGIKQNLPSDITVTVTANGTQTLTGTLAKVSGDDSLSNYTWTLASGQAFPWNSTITVTVSAHDKAGNPLDPTQATWSFDVVTDHVAPVLGSLNPASGATNVATNKKLSFHITDDNSGVDIDPKDGFKVQVSAVSNKGVSIPIGPDITSEVLPASGTALDYAFTWDPAAGGHTLLYNATYTIKVTAKDFAGNAVTPSSWSFSTPVDTTAPQADTFVPAKNATEVPTDTAISVRLTDAGAGIDPSQIGMVVTNKTDGTPITGTIATRPTAPSGVVTVAFTPDAPLPYAKAIDISLVVPDLAPVPNTLKVTDWTFTTTGAPTYNVTGAITTGGTTPAAIPGVKVDALQNGKIMATTTTLGNGVYQLTGLLAGTYTITPSKAEYVFTSTDTPKGATRTVTIGATEGDASNQDFTGAFATYEIKGTILDKDLKPAAGVAGVVVTADAAGTLKATTAADGTYTITGVPSGTYTVTPTKTNYSFRPAAQSVTVASSTVSNVNFDAVADTFTVSGTVLDYSGNRVQGIQITPSSGQGTVTDEAGRYTVSGIRAGTQVTITPSKAGYSFVPASQTTTVTAAVTGIDFKAYVTFANSFAKGIHMISVPCTPSDNHANVVFGTDAVARWSPLASPPGYDTPATNPSSDILRVRPGTGFFVNFTNAQTLNVPGVPISTSSPLAVSLGPDWNMIGNPYTGQLPLANITTTSGTVRPYAFAWDNASGSYILISNVPALGASRNTLRAWEGVWVRAVGGVASLKMQAPVSTAEVAAVPKYDAPQGSWVIPVVAKASGRQDLSASCGVIPAANSDLNIDNPPTMTNTVDIYFLDENRKPLQRMILPSATGTASWDMIVRTDISNTQVELTMPDLSQVPSNLAVTLVDVDAGKRMYARTMSSYTYKVGEGGGARHFNIEVAPRTSGSLVISTASAGQSGSGMVFTFGVSKACSVNAEILNISGRRVRCLASGKSADAGVNTLAWDLRGDTGTVVPGGTYLIRLEAVDSDGQRVSALVNTRVAR